MYDIDEKFFHEDGTVDCETACRAGRKARAEAAGESMEFLKDVVSGLARAASSVVSVCAILFGALSAK
jgi:hypothetical protein